MMGLVVAWLTCLPFVITLFYFEILFLSINIIILFAMRSDLMLSVISEFLERTQLISVGIIIIVFGMINILIFDLTKYLHIFWRLNG